MSRVSVLVLRRFAVALIALVLLVTGCRSGSVRSDARIQVKDAGAPEIVFGTRKAELPPGDVGGEAPDVVQDRAGKRLAYRTTAGMARVLYVLGDGLFVGPLVPLAAGDKVDFRAVPSIDHALAPLFETASPSARRELVKEIRREKGEAGIVRLLIDAVYVDDIAWEETKRTLAPGHEKELRDGLVTGLDTGKPAIVLRRSLAVVDLKAEWRKKMIPERAKELLALPSADPAASAVFLRASLYHDKEAAGAIACSVFDGAPARDPRRLKLEEAAYLVLLTTKASCGHTASLADACLPYFRCNAEGPLSWSTTSNQDEPLCTEAEIMKAAEQELDRPAAEVLDSGASRAGLFAYGLALSKGHVPSSFENAHARRRYAITQPTEPPCDNTLAPGTACHCEEAVIRSTACKTSGSGAQAQVEAYVCRFDVDDKAKKIQNVVVGTPGNHPAN